MMLRFMHGARRVLALWALAGLASVSVEGAPGEALSIPEVTESPASRRITVSDLTNLRYIARTVDGRRLSLSPQGDRIAFQVFQGDPQSNRYRAAWFVSPVAPGARPINVGDGGEVIIDRHDHGAGSSGMRLIAAVAGWSPDGQWIAYLAQHGGKLQLWRSRADGTLQERVSPESLEVSGFA